MANRISIYEADAMELREQLGTAEDLDAEEVASGLMALCKIVAAQEAEIESLRKEVEQLKQFRSISVEADTTRLLNQHNPEGH